MTVTGSRGEKAGWRVLRPEETRLQWGHPDISRLGKTRRPSCRLLSHSFAVSDVKQKEVRKRRQDGCKKKVGSKRAL